MRNLLLTYNGCFKFFFFSFTSTDVLFQFRFRLHFLPTNLHLQSRELCFANDFGSLIQNLSDRLPSHLFKLTING